MPDLFFFAAFTIFIVNRSMARMGSRSGQEIIVAMRPLRSFEEA